MGILTEPGTSAWEATMGPAMFLGNKGQRDAVVKDGWPFEGWAVCVVALSDMLQWCAPWRRQQAGRRASSLARKAATKGPSPRKRTRKMDTARRIWNSC